MKKKCKVGLVLGSGTALGLAHIGVLKVLEKEGIWPDYIAGASMGSIIGAIYAAGYSATDIEGILKTMNWKRWLKFLDLRLGKSGFIRGNEFNKYLEKILMGKEFKDLSIPLKILATDLEKGKPVILQKGKVIDAVRASMAIPGVFYPQKVKKELVDGGLYDPLPVDLLKRKGCKLIIAVDVLGNTEMSKKRYIPEILLRSLMIMQNRINELKKFPKNCIIIKPHLLDKDIVRFDRWRTMVKRGEIAAKKALPEIKKRLK